MLYAPISPKLGAVHRRVTNRGESFSVAVRFLGGRVNELATACVSSGTPPLPPWIPPLPPWIPPLPPWIPPLPPWIPPPVRADKLPVMPTCRASTPMAIGVPFTSNVGAQSLWPRKTVSVTLGSSKLMSWLVSQERKSLARVTRNTDGAPAVRGEPSQRDFMGEALSTTCGPSPGAATNSACVPCQLVLG